MYRINPSNKNKTQSTKRPVTWSISPLWVGNFFTFPLAILKNSDLYYSCNISVVDIASHYTYKTYIQQVTMIGSDILGYDAYNLIDAQ